MLVTTDSLEAAYELLRATAPFNRWKLPHCSRVKFKVMRYDICGEFIEPNIIRVSQKRTRTLVVLLMTLAHEMIHLHQHLRGSYTTGEHNREFHRIADRICKIHLWDRGLF